MSRPLSVIKRGPLHRRPSVCSSVRLIQEQKVADNSNLVHVSYATQQVKDQGHRQHLC